jgi:hypothetical protein
MKSASDGSNEFYQRPSVSTLKAQSHCFAAWIDEAIASLKPKAINEKIL